MNTITVGDKIRIRTTGEAAEIVEVVNDSTAKVDTFDGVIEVKASEIRHFEANDKNWQEQESIVFEQPKTRAFKQEKKQSFNDRKNQFSYELDLHAEALISDIDGKSDEEILTIQISRAKSYIQQAIEFRAQRVYLIHGVGSGRLKSEVNQLLREIKGVKEAINEYHPKYGMGVTEVRLR